TYNAPGAMADSLRTVIGATLVIGGALTGVLVLRESRFAPEWVRPPAAEPSASADVGLGGPALPPATTVTVPPPPPPAAAPTESAPPEPSASTPEPIASASAGRARKPVAPAAAQPGEPAVVELPPDFQYSPKGSGNLTFPVAPATASTSTGQAR